MNSLHDAPVGALAPPCLVTVDQVVDALIEAVAKAGSQKTFCDRHAVQPGDLSMALRRLRPPTKAMMRAVGVVPALVQKGLPL